MGDAAAALGGLDVLVNNVGIARQARFEDVTDEEWDAYWQLNVMSYVRAIRAALPLLRASGGVIVNVSSTAGKRPSSGMPHYSVTKAAVLSLSRLVADLYAKDGIRCNAVTPGPTETDAWLGDGGLADQQGDRGTEVLAKVGRRGKAAKGQLASDKPVLLDFWGTKCEPCKALMPAVEKLVNAGTRSSSASSDTAENRRLAISQKVLGLPPIAMYKDGAKVEELTQDKATPDNIEEMLKRYVLALGLERNKGR